MLHFTTTPCMDVKYGFAIILCFSWKLYVVGLLNYQLDAKFDFVTLSLSRPCHFEGPFEAQVLQLSSTIPEIRCRVFLICYKYFVFFCNTSRMFCHSLASLLSTNMAVHTPRMCSLKIYWMYRCRSRQILKKFTESFY